MMLDDMNDDYDVFDGIMMVIYDYYDLCYLNRMMFSILSLMYVMNAMLDHVKKSAEDTTYE